MPAPSVEHVSGHSSAHLRRGVAMVLAAAVGLVTAIAAPAAQATAGTVTQIGNVPVSTSVAITTRTCSATAIANNAALKNLRVTVYSENDLVNSLFEKGSTTTDSQASVMKLVTSVVATKVLGNNYRFTTKVYATKKTGTIVIVGGGDPTLSSAGKTVYPGAATMKTLARQIKSWAIKKKVKIKRIIVDTSAYDSANLKGPWDNADIKVGYVSRISALMVDGDRAVSTSRTSPRSSAPAKTAAAAFRSAVFSALNTSSTPKAVKVSKKSAISVSYGKVAKKAAIASVSSQPLSKLLTQMLPYSDNTLSEALAIRVTKTVTGKASYAQVNKAYHTVLSSLGIAAAGMHFADGSGMSKSDRMSTRFLARLVPIVYTNPSYSKIVSAMPVVGKVGTLASKSRFATSRSYSASRNDQIAAAKKRGHIVAKDGFLYGLLSLTGTLTAADGTRLYFSVVTIDGKFYRTSSGLKSYSSTYPMLDYLVSRFYTCGSNLAAYGS